MWISPKRKLQNMQINVDKLRKKQEKSAGDVAAARAEYETRKRPTLAVYENFRNVWEKVFLL